MLGAEFGNAVVAAGALGAACAVLSVVVVVRQWAFIGEGIAHSAFGGVGAAWLLSLLVPILAEPGPSYLVAVAFSIAAALGIGALSRRGIRTDTAIGIFLAGTLAFAFMAQSVYRALRGAAPPAWEMFLIGDPRTISGDHALAGVLLMLVVLGTVAALRKEIMAYCFDPVLAGVSGVPVALVHYTLLVLIAVLVMAAMKFMGALLVTALLVLPGATALQLTRRTMAVALTALLLNVGGAAIGVAGHALWPPLPTGPAIAIVLLLAFVVALLWRRWRARPTL